MITKTYLKEKIKELSKNRYTDKKFCDSIIRPERPHEKYQSFTG